MENIHIKRINIKIINICLEFLKIFLEELLKI